ncbi:RNA polymerase sigma factor [Planococcus sp. FY231025]|uniref:RNA polymerase sigma factor n=1 Tax=Planococcus sp. FY231025 TaxID=3455699 RepID=UPI003F8F1C2D
MEANAMHENLKDDLIRFARSISRHDQEAYDQVQDAWEKSLKESALQDLPIHKQRAWFFRVMKNRLIDDRRRDHRLSAWETDMDFPDPRYAASGMEMAELLGKLSPELGDLVFKRYWLGMTSQEIGKGLGIPAATVRYKLHQAIKRLRKHLEGDL